jgi:predicted RNA-binding protein with PIN domain
MKKNYIIDGFNLGFKIPSIAKWIQSGHTDHVIQLIKSYLFNGLVRKANQIIIVFDGKKENVSGNSKQGKMQVIFSKKPNTADDIIRKHIRSVKNASQWIVVSSDSEIRYTAKDMGAESIKSEKLIATLNQDHKKDQYKLNKEKYQPENVDMDYWLKKFNQSGDDSQ